MPFLKVILLLSQLGVIYRVYFSWILITVEKRDGKNLRKIMLEQHLHNSCTVFVVIAVTALITNNNERLHNP